MQNIGRNTILWCTLVSLGLLFYNNDIGVIGWVVVGILLSGLLLVEVLNIHLKKLQYTSSFPTTEYIKDILTEDKDISKNIEKLIEIIDGCMDIIQSKHLDIYFSKEKILTIRQISCTINAIDAATEHRAEATRREILDILEKRKGRLSITEIYMIYIVLCRWKQSIL